MNKQIISDFEGFLAKLKADYLEEATKQPELLVPEGIDFRCFEGQLRLVFNNGKSELLHLSTHGGVPFVTIAGDRYDKDKYKVRTKLVQATEFKAGEWYVMKGYENSADYYTLILNEDEEASLSSQLQGVGIIKIDKNARPEDFYRVTL